MIIPVYKPKGPTSHDIIDAVRKITGERKVGHAGTLDPLASGVLVVAIGRDSTKHLADEVKKEKEYVAVVKFGETSTTDDAEGDKNGTGQNKEVDRGRVEDVVQSFVGHVQQTPPVYSAVKVKGRPAHRRVRKGEEITLAPRTVEIREIEILDYTWPLLELRVVTGPGVYIRALARDIGEKLGTGGYLASLERIRVGQYTKEDARSLTDLGSHYAKNT